MINPGKSYALLGLLVLLAMIPATLFAQQQRIEVQLSSNRVTVDESVILNVRAYGMDKEIDYSALNGNFDVTQRSSSRQVTIENGKRTSLVEWVLELIPKSSGALEVPPIQVGSEQSRPITLLVEPSPTGSNRDVFLESQVDVSNPFVQAQVIYTLRVYQDVRFLDASLQVPELDGVVMQQLGKETSYQQTVDGRNYNVTEIRYALFPQSSGKIIIPSMALQAVIPVNRQQVPNTRTRTKRLTRRSNEVELDVQSRPDGLVGSWWLPATDVRLQSEWSESIERLGVDQPVTRTITLMATGVGDSQLPELSVPEIENISVYADSPTAATNTSERGLLAQQTNTWAVIAQTPGQLTFPEVQVNWFDTKTGEARVAVLPAETLNVVGKAAAADNLSASPQSADEQQPPVPDSDALGLVADNPIAETIGSGANALSNVVNQVDQTHLLASVQRWRQFAYALIAGWLLTVIGMWLWWRKRGGIVEGRSPNQVEETSGMRFQRRAGSKAALEPVREACESGDAKKIAHAVLSWGAMVWPEKPPTHMSEVAKRLKSSELTQALNAVDAQQFRPSGGVNSLAVESIPGLLKSAVDQYTPQSDNLSDINGLPSL